MEKLEPERLARTIHLRPDESRTIDKLIASGAYGRPRTSSKPA